MALLPRYAPLDRTLLFEASVEGEHLAGAVPSQTRISYPISLGPAKQDWGPYCLAVTRQPVTSPLPAANSPAGEIAALLAQPLRYLEITLSARGVPLKLRNHAAIWQQWQEQTAPAIQAAYTGGWVTKIITQAEARLQHADVLLQSLLGSDWILHTYFSTLQKLAGGSASPALLQTGGRKIRFRERLEFLPAEDGSLYVEIEGTGEGNNRQDSKTFEAHNYCRYQMLPYSVWASGYDCTYTFKTGEQTEKNIRLQLNLL